MSILLKLVPDSLILNCDKKAPSSFGFQRLYSPSVIQKLFLLGQSVSLSSLVRSYLVRFASLCLTRRRLVYLLMVWKRCPNVTREQASTHNQEEQLRGALDEKNRAKLVKGQTSSDSRKPDQEICERRNQLGRKPARKQAQSPATFKSSCEQERMRSTTERRSADQLKSRTDEGNKLKGHKLVDQLRQTKQFEHNLRAGVHRWLEVLAARGTLDRVATEAVVIKSSSGSFPLRKKGRRRRFSSECP
ncbi:phosphoribosyltransferase [Dorcoceras hygrometricum]|uniref:Phosphoribosyltransferase n=1 Tax=Dorcoceras hygrometricum TaxID=472368 RepID=A0A2Z7CKC4_9LAMI|nr:phosphoribosyltransferase [Dorcoceras hygrometricum]